MYYVLEFIYTHSYNSFLFLIFFLGLWEISLTDTLLGNMESKKDPKKAEEWLLKAANANDPQSLYTLGKIYHLGTSRKSPYGDFTVSMKDAYKLYLLSADKGVPLAYYRLARMHRKDNFTENNPDEVLRYASLAIYQQDNGVEGQDCYEIFMYYNEGRDKNLSLYWCGKMAEIPSEIPKVFPSTFIMVDAEDNWYKHTEGINAAGYSVLPLAKRLMKQYNQDTSHAFFDAWKDCCVACRNKDVVANLKVCSGFGVFYFCSKACQIKYWKAGQKKECRGNHNHWIQDFLPNL
jgi:TPR repeat protein